MTSKISYDCPTCSTIFWSKMPCFIPFSFAVVVICGVLVSLGDTHPNKDDVYKKLMRIPPPIKTARKLYKNFLGGDPRRIHKRQILGDFFDVALVIDSSSSVSSGEYRKGLLALKDLVEKSREDTTYAAVTFATRAKIEFNFTGITQAAEKLRGLKRSGGKTNTQAALKLCRTMFVNPKHGTRRGSFRRILVLTDGQSNIKRAETVPSALQLKILGVEVFVIAVGEYLEGIKELAEMASSTDAHMYRVQSLSGLVEIIKLIPDVGRRPWIEEIFGETTEDGGDDDDDDLGPLGKLK